VFEIKMIYIPAGAFQRKWTAAGRETGEDKKSMRLISISKGFWLGKFQITQGQWEIITGNNPAYFKQGAEFPVEQVSWLDIQEFLERLDARSRLRFRLPLEAEWEYACRAGASGNYCFGDDERLLADYAWYKVNSGETTHPVGTKQPNRWGLYDLHGNVWEWCHDWHWDKAIARSPAKDPKGPLRGSFKAMRGGSWNDASELVGSSSRMGGKPSLRDFNVGFRLCLEA
jgi:formylglycine-generating enzyme required for sulfatase activity